MKKVSLLLLFLCTSFSVFCQFGEVKPGTITIYEPAGFGGLIKPNVTFSKVDFPDIQIIGYNTTDANVAHLGIRHVNSGLSTKFFKDGKVGIGYSLFNTSDVTALGIRHSSLITDPHMRLIESTTTEPARLSFDNPGGNYWQLKGFTSNSGINALFNIYSSKFNGDVLSMDGNGNVGIRTSTPTFPFEVNTSATSTNSTTGAMSVGVIASRHLVFDTDEINAYNGTAGNTLILNDESSGDVHIGGGTSSDLQVNGFTRLGGSSAPSIKIKKLIGTTGSTSVSNVAHALDFDKIISFTVLIEQTNTKYQPNSLYANSTYHYVADVDTTNVSMSNVGSNLRNKPYTIVITYEE